MAEIKISNLQALTTPATNDLFVAVDVSDTSQSASGTTKKITGESFFATPAPIGSTTPASGAFTTLSATGGITGGGSFILAASTPSYTAGQMFYDAANGTFSMHGSEPEITLQIGQESWIAVRNESGVTIGDGMPVYISGANGNMPLVLLCDADSLASSQIVGITTHDIENNTNGFVTAFGLVRNLNTVAFANGATLYVSQTAGQLTATAPVAPAYVAIAGVVTRSHVNLGAILVTPKQAESSSISAVTGLQAALDAKVDDTQISAYGLTLADDADAATARATLGLGTAATSNTGDFAATVHTHTIANVTSLQSSLDAKVDDSQISAYGLTLVDDADASTARTTLGLGTAATSNTGDFAATAHTHAAADVTSGTMAVARLGTGTPTSSTFLRGDGAWQTIPGGDMLAANNLSDVSNAVTSFTNIKQAATTTATGVVELATSGESAANLAVQANDARLSDARTPLAHVHSTTDITSGTLATARLGSGTADSTVFLRGDSTWQVVSGGGSQWVTSGANIYYSSGNVGIGNAIPGSFNAAGLPLAVGSGTGNQGVTIYSGNAFYGGIHFADGTTGDASYRGIVYYDHNTDSMQLWTSASERVRINSSGNVGIGISSPSHPLDVSAAGATTASNASSIVRFTGGNNGSNDITLIGPNTSQVRLAFGDIDNALVGSVAYDHGSNALSLTTNSSERLRVDSSGNVGIGTASPTEKLTVAGSISATSYLGTVDGTNKVGFLNVPISGSSKTTAYTMVLTDAGKLICLDTGGYVVIPAGVFAAGDSFAIYNNTSAAITNTCSAVTTAYLTGADADINNFNLSSRAVCTALFTSATSVVISGGVSSPSIGALVAWVNFNGTGTVAIRASGNVSSITDNGTGLYTINLSTSMPDANYAAVAMIRADTDYAPTVGQPHSLSAQTASAVSLKTGSNSAALDSSVVTVAFFR